MLSKLPKYLAKRALPLLFAASTVFLFQSRSEAIFFPAGSEGDVTLQDLALAFAYFNEQSNPVPDFSEANLIARANELLPGTTNDITGSLTKVPDLNNLKAFENGEPSLQLADLAIFFAAFNQLSTLPPENRPSFVFDIPTLASDANDLLPGTLNDISAGDFALVRDPRTLGADTSLTVTLEGIPPRIDVDSGRPFVIPGDILKGTITASKSDGIEAGEITVSVVLNGTFDATPPRPLLTLSDVRLNNSDVNCPVGPTACTGNARVKISDLPEDLITRLQSGTLTVTVNGAGFGIRRTATASIDFRPSP